MKKATKPKSVKASKRVSQKPLSEEKIRKMVDLMPDGIKGFCIGWGWMTFARKIEKAHNIK